MARSRSTSRSPSAAARRTCRSTGCSIDRLMHINGLGARPGRRGTPRDDGNGRSSLTTSSTGTLKPIGRLHLYPDRRGPAVCRAVFDCIAGLYNPRRSASETAPPQPRGVRGPRDAGLTCRPRNRQQASPASSRFAGGSSARSTSPPLASLICPSERKKDSGRSRPSLTMCPVQR